jgi:hypothetical protein
MIPGMICKSIGASYQLVQSHHPGLRSVLELQRRRSIMAFESLPCGVGGIPISMEPPNIPVNQLKLDQAMIEHIISCSKLSFNHFKRFDSSLCGSLNRF